MGNLQIVSFNLWQVLISLANLTILYLGLKKFLYKPVKAVLENRKAAIAKTYEEAEAYRTSANAAREEYAAKLATAHTPADEIVRQGEMEASMEKKKAMETIRQDITDVSAAMTEKLLGREMSAADHRNMIDEFLKGVGED